MRRFFTLFVLLIVSSYHRASACDCSRAGMSVVHFNRCDWIFIGTLISEIPQSDTNTHRSAFYRVIRSYKGVHVGDTVSVRDLKRLGSCGLGDLAQGREYLVYAQQLHGLAYTSKCAGSHIVPFEDYRQDSAYIRDAISIGNATIREVPKTDSLSPTLYRYEALEPFHSLEIAFLEKHLSKTKVSKQQRFLDPNGKLSATGAYKEGLPDGHWSYYEGGKLYEEGNYRHGKKDGVWTTYGVEVEKNVFADGFATQQQTVYRKGRKFTEIKPFGDGALWTEDRYYPSGRLRYRAFVRAPEPEKHPIPRRLKHEGLFSLYSEKGLLLKQGDRTDDCNTGLWKYYDGAGNLLAEGVYRRAQEANFCENQRTGLWTFFHPNRQIKAQGYYDNSRKVGDWRFYDEQGLEIAGSPDFINKDEDWLKYLEEEG